MNVSEKLERAKPVLRSIAGHTDEDGAVRKAALEAIKAYIDEEIAAVDQEIAARIAAL